MSEGAIRPNSSEWLSASEAIEQLIKCGAERKQAQTLILTRAGAGLVRSRCKRRVIASDGAFDRTVIDNEGIPDWTWRDGVADKRGSEDWETGDFSIVHMTAGGSLKVSTSYGVEFSAEDIADAGKGLGGVTKKSTGPRGRSPSAGWPAFAEELACYVHVEGMPAGSDGAGSEKVIREILQRLENRGVEISRQTIQPVIKAVLARIR